ncbi:MAG: PHB depolymerase family esterase [Actinomycetota bacterium]
MSRVSLLTITLLVGACSSGHTPSSGPPATTVPKSTIITVPESTTAAVVPSTTTTLLDLQALPGHRDEIPAGENIPCSIETDVEVVGTPLPVDGYDDRPTLIQPAPNRGAPLLVMLHGQAGCVQSLQSGSDLDVIGAEAGVSVLWLSGESLQGDRSWNTTGSCCEPASSAGVDDLSYIVDAVKAALATGLSPTVVLAVGLSNGAGMAITAACSRPDLFTGVVSVAGWVPVTCGSAALSLLAVGGTEDPSLGAAMAEEVTTMWRSSVTTCSDDPVVEQVGQRTTTTWLNCDDGQSVVRLVQLEGVPHEWPKHDFYDIDDDIIRFAKGQNGKS